MAERLVQTRVGRLKVTVIGDGHRPPALLWHSLFVDERSWERVIPGLSAERDLVVVTGPGHGMSGDIGHRYSMQDCADAAVEVLEAVGVDGAVDWVGNAWGGHVGVVLAARRPDRVRTLVTAGSPMHPYSLVSRLNTQLLVVLYRRFGPIRYIADAVVDALLSDRTRAADPFAAELVRDSFKAANRGGLANAVVSVSLKRLDLKPLLPAVQAPTLFITGSAHPDWSPEQMRAAAAVLPHATTRVVDGAAYLVPLEAPAEFTDHLREFWTSHAQPGPSQRFAAG